MNYEFFIAKRIIGSKAYKSSISAPIIKIGIAAIAIGIIVMMIAIATGIGLQQKIRDKVVAFNGHVTITKYDSNNSQESVFPISKNQDFYPEFKAVEGVSHVQGVASKFGVIRTETDFEGVYLKGVGADYKWNYFKEFLIEGKLPDYTNKRNEDVLISKHLANRLNFKVGDNFQMVFAKDDPEKLPNIITYHVVGIYNSGFQDLDAQYLIGDIRHLQRINRWEKDQVGNFEVFIDDYSELDEKGEINEDVQIDSSIVVGANKTEMYLPLLKGKRVGVVANQTSVIFKADSSYTHIVDSLLSLNIDIQKVFAPEHGFRGKADAGEIVKDGIDTKTNLPIVSLYGKNKKPSKEQLKDLDVVVFDIQDVGARFYTYISSLHYVMEACAETGIPVIVFDRPNPNGHYIDGPVLEMEHHSFVGMHPIPVVHGMTIGEYAKMMNGEKWLANGAQCELEVISIKNYNHNLDYSLPIKPSPNLPNDQSINLYPSLCFFEGTNVSAGRGTETQFQIFGSPFLNPELFQFEFMPQPNFGSKYPKHQNKKCYGKDLTDVETIHSLNLKWLIEAYKNTENKSEFFNAFFTKLAGTKVLQQQIEAGLSEDEIKETWKTDLEDFKKTRENYLIYK